MSAVLDLSRGPAPDLAQYLPSAAPVLKWAGGKTRLLPFLLPMLPPGVEERRHVEPFAGGAAMLFARRPGRALLADVNGELVRTYEMVREAPYAVIAHLARLRGHHDASAYYAARERFNRVRAMPDEERAALFIYLNKTCFNGLHRVNRRGEFNVPMGRYASPRIFDEETVLGAAAALANTELRHSDFQEAVEYARPGDFVYLDPPYVPITATASFTNYACDGFTLKDQERLRDVVRALDRRGCRIMLSNSDAPEVWRLYDGFRIDVVRAPRLISCDASRRAPVNEVVVRNY
ncbi:MAG: DNA adenine methylase [Deltaproteobacteria bacterium]|nr:DNA adenine methylase [Deltaproteobacteria bacterium]